MFEDLPLPRWAAGTLFGSVVFVVGTTIAGTLLGWEPPLAIVLAAVATPFVLVVVTLAAVARAVASHTDDHDEIEGRVARGLGLSKEAFDALLDHDAERDRQVRDPDELEPELEGPPFDGT